MSAIAILAKAPIPGFAKTRLMPHLGPEGAAKLQRWLLQRAVHTALAAKLGPVSLWCAPEIEHPDFSALHQQHGIALRPQPAGDLGERMALAIAESAAASGTLLIGTDCPLLTPAHLQQAAASLADHAACVTPAEDGGYVLMGLRTPMPTLFDDIAWSTDQVMAQTRQRLQTAGARWHEMPMLWDVDRAEDFERLTQHFPELRSLIAQVPA